MNESPILKKKSVATIFTIVTAKISKFTKVDDVANNSVFNTPVVKLAASFFVVIMIAYALYLAGNVILLLINLSLTQYLVLVSVVTVIFFFIMMAAEEDSATTEIEEENTETKYNKSDNKDLKQ